MNESALARGVRGKSRACGQERIFEDLLKFARGCEACGFSYDGEYSSVFHLRAKLE